MNQHVAKTPNNHDTPEFLRAGLDWCQHMSGARRVILWFVDEAAGLVRARALTGGAAPGVHVLHGSPIAWTARERVPANFDPVPTWATTQRVFGIPVLEGAPNHALTFELADDVDVAPSQFEALGIYLGALLAVLHDHDVLAAYQTRTEHLLDALRLLPTASNMEDVSHQMIAAARTITGGGGAAITAWNGETGHVLIAEGAGPIAGGAVSGEESLTGLAARSGAAITRDASTLRPLKVITGGEKFLPAPETVVALPLATHGTVVGVLTAWSNARIPETAITALETLAPYAAVQLLHAQELGSMRSLAERDPLTGLNNRRAFDAFLGAETARYERYGRPFALIMLDIDFFKKINDTHGHDVGDEAIRKVAQLVAGSLRDVDIAARYGGEEFAVILPETSLARAIDVAERIRTQVEAAATPQLRLTISAGVAAAPDNGIAGSDLVRNADRALYTAKQEGRNRVCRAVPLRKPR